VQLVYVAGPYTGPDANSIHDNIEKARRIAVTLWKEGYAVICPHLNSAHMDGVVSWEQFMEADLLILSKCDAIALVPGWEKSKGACMEFQKAQELGLRIIMPDDPIYVSLGDAYAQLVKKSAATARLWAMPAGIGG
jgi:hypothetical protein